MARDTATIYPASAEARAAARSAGLRYVNDTAPGITRRRVGERFAYRRVDGSPLRDREELARVRALAVPPAYTHVWICPHPRGHLQATGRDARGRKQYRYHPAWRATRDATKYEHMLEFGRALPTVRRAIEAQLDGSELGRERVLATIVWLLDHTLVRVGNEEYARANKSFGLTTLRTRHLELRRSGARFAFRGKSGIEHQVTVADPRVVRALQRCAELPGQELFKYLDEDGTSHSVDSQDVNDYLQRLSGGELTAKDYRTWGGSVLAMRLLRGRRWASATEARQQLVDTIKEVATSLRNTPAVCRRCYVHPKVVEHYSDGRLFDAHRVRARRHLSADEAIFLRFLE